MMRWLARLGVAALFAFLLAPVILVVPLSFSSANNLVWPPPGWSLRWYGAMTQQAGLVQAAWNSLVLGAIRSADHALSRVGTTATTTSGRCRTLSVRTRSANVSSYSPRLRAFCERGTKLRSRRTRTPFSVEVRRQDHL